jgi:predicted anti-sigma-YlaC factor YlaD
MATNSAGPCRPVREHLSDWLDGQPVPVFAGLMLRLHLRICPPCRRVRRSLEATRDAVRTLRDIDPEIGDDPTNGTADSL